MGIFRFPQRNVFNAKVTHAALLEGGK